MKTVSRALFNTCDEMMQRFQSRRNVTQVNLNHIIYNKPTRCNSGSIVFINNYKYALHVSDALCVHHQEHYKL